MQAHVAPGRSRRAALAVPAALFLLCLASTSLFWHAHLVFADQPAATATVTSADGLNLRSAPSITAALLIVIPGNAAVTVTGAPTADNWYPVQYLGLSGWVDGEFLALTPAGSAVAGTSTASSSPPTATTGTAGSPTSTSAASTTTTGSVTGANPGTATVATSDGLNLRSGPGSSNSVITVLPNGGSVTITGALVGPWVPVTYIGTGGWVDGAFIIPDGPSTVITANATSGTGGASVGSAALARSVSPDRPTVPVAPDKSDMGRPGPPEAGLPVAHPPAGDVLKFIWPVVSHRITTRFTGYHQAIDIDEFPAGHNPVRAIADGIVTFAGGDACCSYGLYVIIQHANGFSSLYAHFSGLEVQQGQAVTQGQEIGRSGSTGNSTGVHLHLAIYYHHDPLDPLSVLPAGADFEPGI
jgi:uncharacterized protein YraI